jgi:hypothetical protein
MLWCIQCRTHVFTCLQCACSCYYAAAAAAAATAADTQQRSSSTVPESVQEVVPQPLRMPDPTVNDSKTPRMRFCTALLFSKTKQQNHEVR